MCLSVIHYINKKIHFLDVQFILLNNTMSLVEFDQEKINDIYIKRQCRYCKKTYDRFDNNGHRNCNRKLSLETRSTLYDSDYLSDHDIDAIDNIAKWFNAEDGDNRQMLTSLYGHLFYCLPKIFIHRYNIPVEKSSIIYKFNSKLDIDKKIYVNLELFSKNVLKFKCRSLYKSVCKEFLKSKKESFFKGIIDSNKRCGIFIDISDRDQVIETREAIARCEEFLPFILFRRMNLCKIIVK
jgi:hypothetical protein